jgi:hypothetical protein
MGPRFRALLVEGGNLRVQLHRCSYSLMTRSGPSPERCSLRRSCTVTNGAPEEWRLWPNNPDTMRLAHPDGALALRVFGCERLQRFARLVEFVGLLDGNP